MLHALASPGGERHQADNIEHILKVVHLYLPYHFPEVTEVYFKGRHGQKTEELDIWMYLVICLHRLAKAMMNYKSDCRTKMEFVFIFLDNITANIIIVLASYHQSNSFGLNN
jgi:hypothetical protein